MCFRPTDVSLADRPLVCPACGNENAPGEKECVFCGGALPQDNPADLVPPAPAPPAAPQPPSQTKPERKGAS